MLHRCRFARLRLYRVIAPDTRGRGVSANASRPFGHADDLAALLRHLGTGPAVLAGVSMGAGIAVDTALEHPDLVRALVAAGPHRSLDEVAPDVVRRVRQMARRTMAKHIIGEPDWRVPLPDTWSRAAGITVPLLAVNGGLDSADHIGTAERLARTVAHGHATAIDGTAHYPNLERPDAFCQALTGFLRFVRDCAHG